MKRAAIRCLALLLLTSTIALTPFYLPQTAASVTLSPVTVSISASADDEMVAIDGQAPASAPNSQSVSGGGFWIVMGFGAVLFSIFVFLTYRRRMAANEDEPDSIG